MVRKVSSAKNLKEKKSVALTKSFIYSRNSRGPNIEPCGTPE